MLKKLIIFISIALCIYSETINIQEISKTMEVLKLEEKRYSDAIEEYIDYYKLDFPGSKHYFGYFNSNDYRLASHIWIPEGVEAKGTIFMQHGYLDNVGYLQKTIDYFLSYGYVIASFDMPGHGLSTGERSGIDEFSTYGSIFADFVEEYAQLLPSNYYSLGHSTGCSMILEYLYNNDSIFEANYFLAPLVRTVKWKTSKVGYHTGKIFLDRIKRIYRESSHDPDFFEFQKDEPLQINSLALSWSRALFNWNKELIERDSIDDRVIVIQGTKDGVVEFRYNLPFLEEKISNIDIHYIEGAEHALTNEAEIYRDRVNKIIIEDLEMRN